HAGRRLCQQRVHLTPQRGIAGTCVREKRIALGRRPLARLVKQFLDFAQALRRHVHPRRLVDRCGSYEPGFQLRMTVIGAGAGSSTIVSIRNRWPSGEMMYEMLKPLSI